jgi:hypothetical protein
MRKYQLIIKNFLALLIIILAISACRESGKSSNSSLFNSTVSSSNIASTSGSSNDSNSETPTNPDPPNGGSIVIIGSNNEIPWKILGSISAGNDSVQEVALRNDFAYVSDGFDGVHIIDLHDPNNPEHAGNITGDNIFSKIQIDGNLAYIFVYPKCEGWCMGQAGDDGELRLFDISQTDSPIFKSSVQVAASNFLAEGKYIYAAGLNSETLKPQLSIINVSDTQNPFIQSSMDIYAPSSLAINNNTLFACTSGLAGFDDILGVDVTTPLNPTLLSRPHDEYALNVATIPFSIYQKTGYVVLGTGGLQIFDLSDPANIHSVNAIQMTSSTNNVEVSGKYMYVSTEKGVEIFDISEPQNPLFITEIPTESSALLTRVNGRIGIVITDAVREQDGSGGFSTIEGEKLRVFLVPQS